MQVFLTSLISFTKSAIPKASCRSTNWKFQVSCTAASQSHAVLILSCLFTSVFHKLSFTLGMGNHSFPDGAGLLVQVLQI